MSEALSPETVVVQLDGSAGSQELQRQLLALPLGICRNVVLDLSGRDALESSAIGVILLLRQALAERGGELWVRGCSDPLLAALGQVRLDRQVEPDRQVELDRQVEPGGRIQSESQPPGTGTTLR